MRFLPFGLASSQGNLEDASKGHSITKFFCLKIKNVKNGIKDYDTEFLHNLCNTYIVPSAFWYQFCTRNVKTILATLIVTTKCCPFKPTATASYSLASCQLHIKVDCCTSVEVYIWSPGKCNIVSCSCSLNYSKGMS